MRSLEEMIKGYGIFNFLRVWLRAEKIVVCKYMIRIQFGGKLFDKTRLDGCQLSFCGVVPTL